MYLMFRDFLMRWWNNISFSADGLKWIRILLIMLDMSCYRSIFVDVITISTIDSGMQRISGWAERARLISWSPDDRSLVSSPLCFVLPAPQSLHPVYTPRAVAHGGGGGCWLSLGHGGLSWVLASWCFRCYPSPLLPVSTA